MKKVFSLALSLTLAMFIFAGCGTSPKANINPTSSPTSNATSNAKDDSVKTGLAVISSIAKSTDAGEKDGLAEVDSTILALTIDKSGKIVKCAIDSAQTKINFSAAGKITTDLKAELKTKQELGTGYGMKKASAIGKEWNEEADAFAKYVVGKTVDQVKGIAVNEKGAATDKELASSVTVSIGDFKDAVEKAAKNAQDLGAKSGDKLGLGVSTSIAKSTDAGEKDGLAQAYSYYTASTFAADGKITSSVIDASQTNVNFSAKGKLTTDLKAPLQTKNELGPKYGMAQASSLKKEWNEEANAFAKYVVGKTADQVNGIAVNEKGSPTGSELTSSVTISIGDFKTILQKASKNAK